MATVHSESSRDARPASRALRDVTLEEAAVDAARALTTTCVRVLLDEGRPIEGGWPGTMSEARARSAELAARALLTLSLPPLTHDELGRVARIAYDEARRLWRART